MARFSADDMERIRAKRRRGVPGRTPIRLAKKPARKGVSMRHDDIQTRRQIAVALHEEGCTVRWIARVLGVGKSSVHRILKREGFDLMAGVERRRVAQVERIRQLHWDHGWTYEEVGWMLGISAASVRERMIRAGISGRKGIFRREEDIIERRRRVAELYAAGQSAAEVAARLRITGTTVLKDLRAAGGQPRRPGWKWR